MSEYESLSKWAHKFNQTDEMIRGDFTAVVERKRDLSYNFGNSDFYSVKVFWNGEAVFEYESTAGSVSVINLKTEWHLQGQGAEEIFEKYSSLLDQLGRAAE